MYGSPPTRPLSEQTSEDDDGRKRIKVGIPAKEAEKEAAKNRNSESIPSECHGKQLMAGQTHLANLLTAKIGYMVHGFTWSKMTIPALSVTVTLDRVTIPLQ